MSLALALIPRDRVEIAWSWCGESEALLLLNGHVHRTGRCSRVWIGYPRKVNIHGSTRVAPIATERDEATVHTDRGSRRCVVVVFGGTGMMIAIRRTHWMHLIVYLLWACIPSSRRIPLLRCIPWSRCNRAADPTRRATNSVGALRTTHGARGRRLHRADDARSRICEG